MASLVSVDGDVVSFIESEPFILVWADTEPSTGAPAPGGAPPLPPGGPALNGNDARTVRLVTAQVDGTVEDNTTGSPSPPA